MIMGRSYWLFLLNKLVFTKLLSVFPQLTSSFTSFRLAKVRERPRKCNTMVTQLIASQYSAFVKCPGGLSHYVQCQLLSVRTFQHLQLPVRKRLLPQSYQPSGCFLRRSDPSSRHEPGRRRNQRTAHRNAYGQGYP